MKLGEERERGRGGVNMDIMRHEKKLRNLPYSHRFHFDSILLVRILREAAHFETTIKGILMKFRTIFLHVDLNFKGCYFSLCRPSSERSPPPKDGSSLLTT
jgi:hypothetical protein